MPESLASHLAEQLNDKQNDRASFAFRGSGSATAFAEEFCAEIDGYDFERPRCFFNFGEDETYYHTEIQRVITSTAASMKEKFEVATVAFCANSKTAVLLSSASSEIVFNDPSMPTPSFSYPGHFVPFSVCKRAWRMISKIDAMPTAGLGEFQVVIRGYALITIIPISTIIEHGHSIDSISALLGEVDVDVLAKCSSFGVAAGGAVWCPMGSLPLQATPLPPNIRSDNFRHYSLLRCCQRH
jgi:hypothetical protein